MLVYSIFGLLYAAAIVFLLFAYRGFAQEQKRNRSSQNVVTELKGRRSKEPPYTRCRLALLFFASPGLCLASLEAQTVPPTTLPLPAMAGSFRAAVPVAFDARPYGQLDATCVLDGFDYWENHPISGDRTARVDVNDGQVFEQKPSGTVHFCLQAGVYNLPAVGTPILSTRNTILDGVAPLPQPSLKTSLFSLAESFFVQAFKPSQGDAFGPNGRSDAQPPGVIETGFLF